MCVEEVVTGLSMCYSGQKETMITYSTLLPIAGGVVIASGGEPLFNIIGFAACLLATAGRALKSVVQVSRVCICLDNATTAEAARNDDWQFACSIRLIVAVTVLGFTWTDISYQKGEVKVDQPTQQHQWGRKPQP
jgi:hypothetical protein